MKKVSMFFALLLSFSALTEAYTYSAAGKEPLIDGREALLVAVHSGDFSAATSIYSQLADEVLYFKTEYGIDLDTPMRQALAEKKPEQVNHTLNQIYTAEIDRRITGAEKNINDYQVAKVMVVKSKLFLDLLTPQLAPEERSMSVQAIQGALKAIGNPGVFGVGAEPADLEALTRSHQLLMKALQIYGL